MEPAHDPDDFFFVLDGCRDLLEEMGQTVRGHYFSTCRVREGAKRQLREERLWASGHSARGTHHVDDSVSRFSHSKPVADLRRNYCRGVGHLLSDRTILKAKEQRLGSIGGGSALNFNTISSRLAAKRRTANKRGKGETASTGGACFTSRPPSTPRPTAEALIAPLVRSVFPSSVHVTTLRVATPSGGGGVLTVRPHG